MVDQKQVPDVHGLSIDSLRGSEHFIDQTVYANVNGQMEAQPRETLSFHEAYNLARVGREPEAQADEPAQDTAPDPNYASTDRVAELERTVQDLLARPTLSPDEWDTLSKRLANLEQHVRAHFNSGSGVASTDLYSGPATTPQNAATPTETPATHPGPETPLHPTDNGDD